MGWVTMSSLVPQAVAHFDLPCEMRGHVGCKVIHLNTQSNLVFQYAA